MEQRTRRSPARFLAPLALIAVVVAFVAILNDSSNSGSSGGSATTPATETTSTAKKAATTGAAAKKAKKQSSAARTYTVQVGDTLGGIADKTGVPLDRIETLNPNVDPHAMVTGQKIRLK